ncbi:MAG: helix-turn-helix transcriptional regulator [Synergistaceae bacterium]|nr:helix-turn-helix transcriptional regulator [Synergistaceae bacterium]
MLKRLSKEKNVNQSDLARHLELTRQSISLYYSGKITPELDTLVKIAEYFDVSLDYLVTGDRPEHNQVRAELGLSEKAIENLKNHQDDSAARNILLSDENFYSEFSEAMKMFLIFDLMTQDVKVFNDKFSD